MKIYKLEQNTEAWYEFRRGKIGGSKAGGIKPTTRGKAKGRVDGTAGFWKLLAERVSIAKDGESDMERGHRLEETGIKKTNQLFNLNLVWKTEANPELPGLWVSDVTEDMYISPDAAEMGDKPTYACEVKAFDTHKHLQIMYEDIQAKKSDSYNAIDSLPSDNVDQVLDYFVVNPDCKTVYWTMINDMVALENLEHYVIVIHREDVDGLVENLHDIQEAVLEELAEKLSNIKNWSVK